jgi:hypothetical protein
VAELRAKFTADDSQFAAKLNGMKSQLGGLKSVFGGLAAGFGVQQVVQFASSVANVASELADASDALGIATSDLQALQVFAIKAGLSIEKLEAVLNRVGSARLEAIADPAGEAAKKFAALGISVKQLSSMSVTQSIAALGKQMDALSGNEWAMSAAKDILGVKSPRAVGVVKEYGRSGVQAAREMSQEFMMTEKAVKSLDASLDKLTLTKMKAKSAIGNAIGEALDPDSPWFIGWREGSLSDRLKKGRSFKKENDVSRVKDLISNPTGTNGASTGAGIKEAMDRQLKSASSMNVSDPFAAVGRAAGRDVTSETLGALYKIVENTSRIQPTPAPVMR